MGCGARLSLLRHLVFGVLLGAFNLGGTAVNIYYLFQEHHTRFATLSLLLLWLPGLVTSLAFLILYTRGSSAVTRLSWWKVVAYPLALLLLYPLLPILLTLAYLCSRDEALHQRAVMSKYFTAFLDHGPQFVLRLVLVVLVGVSERGVYSRHDTIFILSMVTAFISMVYTALWFNERSSSWLVWLFLAGPMYAATFACRAFTLSVLLKATLHDGTLAIGALLALLLAMVATNLILFRLCGQDWTRSAVFGVASTLLPAGYTNDLQHYQVPGQDILHPCHLYQLGGMTAGGAEMVQRPLKEGEEEVGRGKEEGEEGGRVLVPMRAGKFLALHVAAHTLYTGLASTAVYFGGTLDTGSDDALVIPQVLGAVPGLLFALGRCCLMPDLCPDSSTAVTTCQKVFGGFKRGGRVCLAVLCSCLGFLALLPAVFWTVVYKWLTSILHNLQSDT